MRLVSTCVLQSRLNFTKLPNTCAGSVPPALWQMTKFKVLQTLCALNYQSIRRQKWNVKADNFLAKRQVISICTNSPTRRHKRVKVSQKANNLAKKQREKQTLVSKPLDGWEAHSRGDRTWKFTPGRSITWGSSMVSIIAVQIIASMTSDLHNGSPRSLMLTLHWCP